MNSHSPLIEDTKEYKEYYIDAHCHLADPRMSSDEALFQKILSRSQKLGVTRWIQGGVDPSDWDRQEHLASRLPNQIIPCFGLHPWWVAQNTDLEIEKALEELEKRAEKAVGLGEMGLDFHFFPDSAPRQIKAFQRQLQLSLHLQKPIVLHIVKAHEIALNLLKQTGIPQCGGLVHSFSGGPEMAHRYVDLGLTLSISGVIARKGFESLKRAVLSIPTESLVVETDSPDQAPDPHQKLNEPSHLVQIAEVIATLKGKKVSEVLESSTKNLEKVFGLKK